MFSPVTDHQHEVAMLAAKAAFAIVTTGAPTAESSPTPANAGAAVVAAYQKAIAQFKSTAIP